MSKQVVVTLTALNGQIFPLRRTLILSPTLNTIPIGRASKSLSKGLIGAEDNAWVDSPVMSRDHAEMRFDSDGELLTIQDTGSMHGTYVNGIQLPADERQVLHNLDVLVFGAEVRRGTDTYPACTFQVNYEISPYRASNTYKFPDSSDIEEDYDISDDEIDASSHASDVVELGSINRISERVANGVNRDESLQSSDDSISSVTPNRLPTIFMENDVGGEQFSSESDDDSDAAPWECSSFEDDGPKDDVNEFLLSHLQKCSGSLSEGSADDDKGNFGFSETAAAGINALLEDGLLTETPTNSWTALPRDDYKLLTKQETTWQTTISNDNATISAKAPPTISDSQAMEKDCGADIMADQITVTPFGIARQPSPSDAAMVKTTIASISQQPVHRNEGLVRILNPVATPTTLGDASESLGIKTGKEAFFAARESNKLKVRAANTGSTDCTQILWPVKQYEHSTTTLQPESWGAAERHTANKWDYPLPVTDAPELDMTSAAKYNESKASLFAAATKPTIAAPARPNLSINDIIDDPTSTNAKELKRKADEISDDIATEVRVWAASSADTSKEPEKTPTVGSSAARVEPLHSSCGAVAEGLDQRPVKKMKKLVEAIGYVALGGAAVGAGMFSLLVVTAPDFL